MSLIKQLWFAILLVILLSSGGSFILSVLTSKAYLEQQLFIKNTDNATVLALSISHLEKDMTTIELFMAAQFDAGHYKSIRLTSPNGETVAELLNNSYQSRAPNWFIKLLPIRVSPATANIQDGWKQYGMLTLESDASFAYDALWDSAKFISLWALVIGLFICIVGSKLLRKILYPLNDVIAQAEALGQHRFITIQEPKTAEFKAVVKAMNKLSEGVRHNAEQEISRLKGMLTESSFDVVTGLMNHNNFVKSVDILIKSEDYSNEGALVIIRVLSLASVNQAVGYQQTNMLLSKLGLQVSLLEKQYASVITGRLSGSDIALFHHEKIDNHEFAKHIKNSLHNLVRESNLTHMFEYLFLTKKMYINDATEDTYQQVNHILNQTARMIDNLDTNDSNIINISAQQNDIASDKVETFNRLFQNAVDQKSIKLEYFPVVNQSGGLIHYECPVRLKLDENSQWLTAGEFITTATQLNLMNKIDLLVLDTALQNLTTNTHHVSLNISASGITDPKFIQALSTRLKVDTALSQRICFEVPEYTAYQNLDAFKAFCKQVKLFKCKIAIEHASVEVSRLSEMYDLGLDFIKIDQSLIRNIQHNEANKVILNGLCIVAHSLGVLAIAEGVKTKEETITLKQLGLDGMTGPGVTLQS